MCIRDRLVLAEFVHLHLRFSRLFRCDKDSHFARFASVGSVVLPSSPAGICRRIAFPRPECDLKGRAFSRDGQSMQVGISVGSDTYLWVVWLGARPYGASPDRASRDDPDSVKLKTDGMKMREAMRWLAACFSGRSTSGTASICRSRASRPA